MVVEEVGQPIVLYINYFTRVFDMNITDQLLWAGIGITFCVVDDFVYLYNK